MQLEGVTYRQDRLGRCHSWSIVVPYFVSSDVLTCEKTNGVYEASAVG